MFFSSFYLLSGHSHMFLVDILFWFTELIFTSLLLDHCFTLSSRIWCWWSTSVVSVIETFEVWSLWKIDCLHKCGWAPLYDWSSSYSVCRVCFSLVTAGFFLSPSHPFHFIWVSSIIQQIVDGIKPGWILISGVNAVLLRRNFLDDRHLKNRTKSWWTVKTVTIRFDHGCIKKCITKP